jgi:hypothetical protein
VDGVESGSDSQLVGVKLADRLMAEMKERS